MDVILTTLSANKAPEVSLASKKWSHDHGPWVTWSSDWFKRLNRQTAAPWRATSVADITQEIIAWAEHWNTGDN